ncbi:MAG: ADP-ribosylglycohydrolase family protein [Geminicoccales bacterium]
MQCLDRASDLDRAKAALYGLALGDAIGMPTQTLDRATIRERYGKITDFVDPFHRHPVSHGLAAGQVTDDTEQAMLLARRLIATPNSFDQTGWAKDLLSWEQEVQRRGLLDLLGPSSKLALTALREGVPAFETGKEGTTNGAAMRILPVGIATPSAALQTLLDRVATVCRVTHNTGEAIAGAAAVATVIAAGVDGATFDHAFAPALKAARMGQDRGHPKGVPDMAARIERALTLAERGDPDLIADEIGTSVASHESVPAAFSIVHLADGDPWQAALIAANIGDDTDTIGAIAASMAAACRGMGSLPQKALDKLRAVNTLPMEELAAGLLNIRHERVTAVCLEDTLS